MSIDGENCVRFIAMDCSILIQLKLKQICSLAGFGYTPMDHGVVAHFIPTNDVELEI